MNFPTYLSELLSILPTLTGGNRGASNNQPATPEVLAAPPAANEPPSAQQRQQGEDSLDRLRAQAERRDTAAPQASVLDMLRQRMSREMEGEDLRRLSDLGAGMLRSSSPNFFTMLSGGMQAQREGEVSRTNQLRQLAELERQDAAQRAEEAYRREQTRLEGERRAAEAPLRAAQADQARALAEYYRQGGRGGGAAAAGVTPQLRLRAEAQAATEARQRFPDPPSTALNRENLVEQVRRQREEYVAQRLPALLQALQNPGAAPAAPAAAGTPSIPTIEITPTNRPVR